MAKFNVGDKVTFRTNLEVGKQYGGFTFEEDMCEVLGGCFTVNEVDVCDESYQVEELFGRLSEEMLILWSDLTTMDIVQMADRSGKTYITGSMRYNKSLGFYGSDGEEWCACAFQEYGLSDFIHLKNWKECKSTFTVNQAKLKLESLLGIEVEITD